MSLDEKDCHQRHSATPINPGSFWTWGRIAVSIWFFAQTEFARLGVDFRDNRTAMNLNRTQGINIGA
ncbi:protein serine threonine kinase [Moniliophthora roreri]|nr:protein serine threonine kinase [Moniliophthora roreri]